VADGEITFPARERDLARDPVGWWQLLSDFTVPEFARGFERRAILRLGVEVSHGDGYPS